MAKILKKRMLAAFLCIIIACASFSACGDSTEISSSAIQKEQRSFDAYTNQLFVREMQENMINLRYTLSNPESFGIKSHKISLGSLSKEDFENSIASIENISETLLKFNYDALSARQQLSYDVLMDYCDKVISSASFYYYEEPLRPTTGTQSELPVLLAEYPFSDSCDVTDYLVLLTCMEEYFQKITQFEQEKAKKGLFMPSYAAETVIEACQTFTENPSENYLIDTFNDRVDAMEDISEDKKELYKMQNLSLVENSVIPSYEKLSDTLSELKNTSANEGGLCNFPMGKDYYEFLVRRNTGSSKSVKELQQITEQKRDLDISSIRNLIASNPGLLQNGESAFPSDDPNVILEHLQKAMQKDFYPAANNSYNVNYVHESLENTLAPAFYLTAPIDDTSRNVIYLNKSSRYSGMQLFTTLAHEGFPGHLYQTTGSYQAGLAPIRAILNYPGYVEGWATYVEMISYHYAGLSEELADLLMRNQSAMLSLYATIDMGIHYEGWNFTDVSAFLRSYGISDADTARSIYELIVEEPSHYLKYYIGYLEFLELKEYAKKEFGEDYSERAFHQALIHIGPAPFSILKLYLMEFYNKQNN